MNLRPNIQDTVAAIAQGTNGPYALIIRLGGIEGDMHVKFYTDLPEYRQTHE